MKVKILAEGIGEKDLDENLQIDESYSEDDSNEMAPSDIIAYNELRSCADLFRMYKEKVLDINPDFQRAEVWPENHKTRFIDSLIKKLPIPSMCFSLDYKTEKWQVIDGLQRISSIIKFLDDEKDWKLSTLVDVDERISGQYVSEVKKTDKGILLTRLANLTIPVTVLRCDYSKKNHTNYLFTIFHRLNTGGIKLTNQEIRNAIYNGKFNSLLKDCNKNVIWRRLMDLKPGKTYRFSYEELILRFFAFSEKLTEYDGRLSKFLNEYMSDNRNQNDAWLNEKVAYFEQTVNLIDEKIAQGKTLDKRSNVFVEALLYGIGKNLTGLSKQSAKDLTKYYQTLMKDTNFSEANLREGLAKKPKVLKRFNTAKQIFGGK